MRSSSPLPVHAARLNPPSSRLHAIQLASERVRILGFSFVSDFRKLRLLCTAQGRREEGRRFERASRVLDLRNVRATLGRTVPY